MDRQRKFARTLRKKMTDAERKLWYELRNRFLDGWKFKRQVPIGPYIADFCCADAMLIVEVDGAHHGENRHDQIRDTFLHNEGYRVVRYWNNEVMHELNDVLEDILLYLEKRE